MVGESVFVHQRKPHIRAEVTLRLANAPSTLRQLEAGNRRMRSATRLRWICEVPPMTLCARA